MQELKQISISSGFRVSFQRFFIQFVFLTNAIPEEGRLFEEQKYLDYAARVQSGLVKVSTRSVGDKHARQPSQGPTGGSEQFLVLIQTPRFNQKPMNKEDLLIHAETLTEIAQLKINLFNE